ncbi:MAG TPA: LPXTG cell wall anchor domain-containing protein [Solirubrobacteraceae bacterium]
MRPAHAVRRARHAASTPPHGGPSCVDVACGRCAWTSAGPRVAEDNVLIAARLPHALIATLLACLIVAASAVADGDPASDTLLGQSVFYPYAPTAVSAQRTLNAETAATKKAGFPIKVALIQAPTDLGVIPSLFAKPQQYADFLDQEISFQGKQKLLVVMPNGYGTQGLPTASTKAVAVLKPPAGKTSTDLAQAAIGAVAKLSEASGHPIKGVAGIPGDSTSSGGSSSSTPILIGLIVAAVLVAGALLLLRRRQDVRPAG